MIILPFVAVSAALVAQADDLNFRYVECMFGVAREMPAGTEAADLEARLRNSCTRERSELHRVMIEIQLQRGILRDEAEITWLDLIEDGVASILRAHAQAGALPPQ